jgi:hypothetical protein
MVTLLGTLPAVVVVAISVSVKNPVLLLVALVVMVVSIVALMRFVNSTLVVAELPREVAVFANRRGELEPRARGDLDVHLLRSRDPRWLHVQVGDDRLWVSKRTFGLIVDRMVVVDDPAAGEADDPDEPEG